MRVYSMCSQSGKRTTLGLVSGLYPLISDDHCCGVQWQFLEREDARDYCCLLQTSFFLCCMVHSHWVKSGLRVTTLRISARDTAPFSLATLPRLYSCLQTGALDVVLCTYAVRASIKKTDDVVAAISTPPPMKGVDKYKARTQTQLIFSQYNLAGIMPNFRTLLISPGILNGLQFFVTARKDSDMPTVPISRPQAARISTGP